MRKLFTIFLFFLCTQISWAQNIEKIGKVAINSPLPPFNMQDIKGNEWDMSKLKGKITVFYFWFPDTVKIWGEQMQSVGLQALSFKDKGVQFLAPAWGGSDNIKDFMKLRNYYMEILIDDKDWMYNTLNIDSFPVIAIVGENLMVQKIYQGYDEDMPKLVKEQLTKMLNKNRE